MSRKLQYFNFSARAEFSRYMLHYGKLEFEDIRYGSEWPIKSVKDSLPYGSMPVYEENGNVINQSLAIARYVGSQVGLVPSDPWEQAKLEAIVYTINDMQSNLRSYYMERKTLQGNKSKIHEIFDFFLPRLEKELIAANGHFSEKLSWADFVYVGIIEFLETILATPVQKNYPTTQALVTEVTSLPGVKEYIAKRGPYVLPA